MNLTIKILNILISKYESSSGYFRGVFTRRISLKADNIDGYKSEDYEKKESVHRAVFNLSSEDLVQFTWVRFEEGNLLDKIILNIEEVDRIYKLLDRTPLKVKLQEYIDEVNMLVEREKWVREFKKDVLHLAKNECKFHSLFPRERKIRRALVKTLNGVQEIDEMTERIFSIKYLEESKTFEKTVKSKLIAILRKYINDELEDDQLTQSVGILKNYDEILIKGNFKYCLNQFMVDTSSCINGTSINSDDIIMMNGIESVAEKVITIENKAAYHEYRKVAPINEIVIYIGGFFGKSTRVLLNKIKTELPSVKFYHWGDIDLGGALIFEYLNKVLGGGVHPLNMGICDVEKNITMTQKIDENYCRKLVKFNENYENGDLYDVINYLIDNRIRLEQEALVANGVNLITAK